MLKQAGRCVQMLLLVLLAAGPLQAQSQAQTQAPIAEKAPAQEAAQAQPKVAAPVPSQIIAKPPALEQAKGAPQGSLVIIGGGLRTETTPVWQRIVELAGGKGARIAVFGSASHNPDKAALLDVEHLNAHGADAFVVPVAVKLAGSDYRVAAEDPALGASVRAATGAFFVGGDQARITQALRRPDGSATLMLDSLWDMYRRGGVIAGTSAGAAIMSKTMFYHVSSVLSTLKRGVADGMEMAPGLGFIGDDVFVDQHLLVRGRFARMLPAMMAKDYKVGLGIDENTAMVIHANRDVEVVGYKGALLIDLSGATSEAGNFNVSNAKLSYLDNGDRYNLTSHVFTPSPDKLAGKFDPARPYYRGPLFSADILGHTTVVDMMTKLIDSDQIDAVGVAFGSPRDLQPDLGFEFRLSRVPESVGYASTIADAYSVYNIRLDVLPIQIRQPLYQYQTNQAQPK